tara:strand:+ start:3042 stop:3242 length:201 start_codon:yes stop_codon:yes gene_type:complete
MNKNKLTLKKNKNVAITKKMNLLLKKIIEKELKNLNNNNKFNYKIQILDKFINNNNNNKSLKNNKN